MAAAEFVLCFFSLSAVFKAFPEPDRNLAYDLKIDTTEEYQSLLTADKDLERSLNSPIEPGVGEDEEERQSSIN